jgi:hypothetical protein
MPPGVVFKSYVTLGDSISDHGGKGPYFNDLLKADLEAKSPGLKYVPAAVSGSRISDLKNQVKGLPASLPSPVLVTITSGGNDMQANAIAILQGKDQAILDTVRKDLATALDELTMPGRFGAGVDVYVYEADIYDPSDGTGDFSKCPPPLSLIPKQDTTMIWARWNAVVHDEAVKHGMYTDVLGMHDVFHNHGVPSADSWFYTDCIHPNTPGHEAIHQMFKSNTIAP